MDRKQTKEIIMALSLIIFGIGMTSGTMLLGMFVGKYADNYQMAIVGMLVFWSTFWAGRLTEKFLSKDAPANKFIGEEIKRRKDLT